MEILKSMLSEKALTRSSQSAQVLLSGILDSAFMRSLQSAIVTNAKAYSYQACIYISFGW